MLGQKNPQRRYAPGRGLLAYGMTKHKYCTQLRAGGSNYKNYRILPGYTLLSPPSGSPSSLWDGGLEGQGGPGKYGVQGSGDVGSILLGLRI